MEYKVTDLMSHYIDEEFVTREEPGLSAERIRRLTMEQVSAAPAKKTGKRLGRIVLLAAAFALVMTATALAVYQYGLKDALVEGGLPDMVLADGETVIANDNVMSLAGYSDSDSYKAMVQWQSYWIEYYNTHELSDEEDASVPDAYLAYGAYNQEMMDKLDEIFAEYGLTLTDGFSVPFDTQAQVYALLNVEPFLSGEQEYVTGYAYDTGSFVMENQILLDGTDFAYEIVSNKTYAPMNIFLNLPDEDYEEWTYTTADGVTVDISWGVSTSVILADGLDSHTTVIVRCGSEITYPNEGLYRQELEASGNLTQEELEQEMLSYEERWREGHPVITKDQLEAIADSIDFNIVAQIEIHGEAERQACLAQKEKDDAAYQQILRDETGYDGTLTDDILVGYELDVDDGHTAEEGNGSAMVIRMWETPDGDQIVLRYQTISDGDLEVDVNGQDTVQAADELGVEAYFVYSPNFSEPNQLTWRDEAKGLDFEIDSNGALTAQEMIDQAQRLLADNG